MSVFFRVYLLPLMHFLQLFRPINSDEVVTHSVEENTRVLVIRDIDGTISETILAHDQELKITPDGVVRYKVSGKWVVDETIIDVEIISL